MFTQLKDRKLWYDGDTSVDPNTITDFCLKNNVLPSKIKVDYTNNEVDLYNELHVAPLVTKQNINYLDSTYNIPQEYKEMSLWNTIEDKLLANEQFILMDTNQQKIRIKRLKQEFDLIKKHKYEDYFKLVLYITDTLQRKNIVWNLRGSSIACYVLFIMGVHNIDSVKYNIPYTEFFRS